MIAIGLDGLVTYANTACEKLLGYQSAATLKGQSLAALIVGHSDASLGDCIKVLCNQNVVTNWNHSDGYVVSAVILDSNLLDDVDPVLVVTLTELVVTLTGGDSHARCNSRPEHDTHGGASVAVMASGGRTAEVAALRLGRG
jgi:PAS domain-containing protein